jgi:hypothetical protein
MIQAGACNRSALVQRLLQPGPISEECMSKTGGIIFFIVLILIVFGVVVVASEFIFGRPLIAFIKDFVFLLFRKQ